MNPATRLLALVVLLHSPAAGAEEEPNLRPKIYLEATRTADLVAKEGQKIVVYGETAGSAKSASGTNFVNFKGSEFSLVTFKSDLGLFPEEEPYLAYDAKRIAVEGVITLYRDKPQIKLTDPNQITVLAPDAVFPPPVTKKEKPAAAPAKNKTNPSAAAPDPEPAKPKPPVDPSEYFKK
ncbi:MAG: hypothetical protein GXX91_12945 [Verrucomicrobiaceae bacterium]|nr:hypothetical protein [Verrucomicrobiaceae bacterium]